MGIPLILVSLVLLGLVLFIRNLRRRPSTPLPPGPKGLPLLGNLFQVPSQLLFVKIIEWSKEYGPIYSYNLLGQPIIVMSGLKEACDILDRMSAKTSDRPRLIKINEYLCRNFEFGFAPRNDYWRTHRRAAHESLNVRAAQDFCPIQQDEARILIEGFINHPEIDLVKHIHRHSSSIAWRTLYGHEAIPIDGPDPSAPMEDFFTQVFFAAIPGGSIVDIFPFLNPLIARSKFIRRQSDKCHEEASAFFVKAHSTPQVEGKPSLSSKLKETGDRIGMSTEHECGWLAGSLFLAAQDTTATALRWFLVAMLVYPETASAARVQLDGVVGDRPPTFDDSERLPLIEAMMKEILRWRPPAPSGVPHMAAEDIIYGKYLIPKGAILVGDTWTLCRDPSLYSNGDAFDPSRFLDEKGRIKLSLPDAHDDYLAFGHGRRICIGKSIAINTLWITIAQLLWAFEFEKDRDEHGNEITPDPMAFWDNGATVWPKRFGIKFVPRFPDTVDRLRGALHD
ncbi:cytochrome P450 [Calocera viscosa TUFC12733]|uniref:Cytochrome P450 n=1 Tax=Calocera viscosa (strain TUFC12733) TaxID=1330018 RepID=A0A167RNJ7_CALVF|nr:cytochrome P450 [Calocera viscosa TUFC12733]